MEISKEMMPKHIAIIMDGNRRWAQNNNVDKKIGHKQGAETLKKITKYANKIGLEFITVYAFSTENWKRTQEEVGALMLLLKKYLEDFFDASDTDNIKINVIGNIDKLSNDLKKSIQNVMEKTKNNIGLTLNIAFNYGGRDEITHALKNIGKKIEIGELKAEDITEDMIGENLYTSGQPDPDLLIRTSGEQRLSNFLPWQLVYSEFVFLDKMWPDFNEKDLDDAIIEYAKRNRKFGGK